MSNNTPTLDEIRELPTRMCECANVRFIDGKTRLHCPDCDNVYRRNTSRGRRGWEFDRRIALTAERKGE